MSMSENLVILVGNLGADPEIRRVGASGALVANLRVATTKKWKDKDSGEKKESTEWHSVVVWGNGLVEVIEQYVNKGDRVYIRGELKTRKWQDQNGNDRYSTEVVVQGFASAFIRLSDGARGEGSRDRSAGGGSDRRGDRQGSGRQDPRGDFSHDFDDEIPF